MKRTFHPSRWLTCLILFCVFALSQSFAQQQGGGGRTSGSSRSTSRSYPGTGSIGDAYFSIDPETRRVVTIADEDTTKYISQVLSNLDRPKPQVLIKVVFLEVARNDSLDLGVEGGWRNSLGNGNTGSVAQVFGMSGLGSVVGTNFNSLGQNVNSFAPVPPGAGVYSLIGENYLVTLKAIAQAGKARVLSRPSILARNNQPATITVGQSVPLITSTRYDTFGNAINSVSYQDVGVILRVTPFITADGLVEMIISPQISTLDTSLTVPISPGVNAPVINVRSADTVVVTPDGQTVIIGGLISKTKASSESKIPLLGDIPWLGALFRHRTTAGQDTELMIFLTPYIVEAPTQLAAVSNREIRKSDGPSAFKEEELNKFLDNLPKDAYKQNKSSKQKSSSPPDEN